MPKITRAGGASNAAEPTPVEVVLVEPVAEPPAEVPEPVKPALPRRRPSPRARKPADTSASGGGAALNPTVTVQDHT